MISTATKFEVTTGALKALTTLKEQAIWSKNLHKDVLSEVQKEFQNLKDNTEEKLGVNTTMQRINHPDELPVLSKKININPRRLRQPIILMPELPSF